MDEVNHPLLSTITLGPRTGKAIQGVRGATLKDFLSLLALEEEREEVLLECSMQSSA